MQFPSTSIKLFDLSFYWCPIYGKMGHDKLVETRHLITDHKLI